MKVVVLVLAMAACSETRRGAAEIELEVLRDESLALDQLEIEVWNGDSRILEGRRPTEPQALTTREVVLLTIMGAPDGALAHVEVAGLLQGAIQAEAFAEVELVSGRRVDARVRLPAASPDGGTFDGDADAEVCAHVICGNCVGKVGDYDGDGVNDCLDNCVLDPNPEQRNTDGDDFGNHCDTDLNGDGAQDSLDSDAWLACGFGADCTDEPCECVGSKGESCSCDYDLDGDGTLNSIDQLLLATHSGRDPGPTGCDPDGDCAAGCADNCMLEPNPDQRDTDGDGFGNMCDIDVNLDGVQDSADVDAIDACFDALCTDDPCACDLLGCTCHHDLDGDGRVSLSDVLQAATYVDQPSGPRGCQ